MYRQCYDAFLIKDATLDFEYAEMLWSVLLKSELKLYEPFFAFLDSLGPKKPGKCHRDLWNMMLEFSQTIKSIAEHKESDGWPSFLDNFIEYARENGVK